MSSRKRIAVIGATGAQGGGLVQAILADDSGACAVRAITRNPDGEKGRALAEAGAEVVAADLDDLASLTAAFEG
ncbi:MAG: NmrA family NAD(P)-binding protein, partial [Gemmatimonadetes bacterium]|nr:NmrA family NAD(P)-binding protein [Gemmatimonadota bacterium]